MGVTQRNITLGTAGHIDHGKTALVKCLTGCDTDRLKIEKERGMSIELGFAPCRISNMEVGIVDVPGHENFIKTMVAGASGIDGVIFVIAADDGVMPQTREHLDILTLLGVKHGVVALTKVDCVEPSRLESVCSNIKNFLTGTFLENAPILPVSNITGAGFDGLLDALQHLVDSIEPKRIDGIFRMPIERTFSVKGYGTVVTGIPVSGSASIGDEVTLFPSGSIGKIRAIQVYKRDSNIVMCGQCTAINVPQWDYNTIKRGDVITCGRYFSPQQWYLCRLRLLDSVQAGLKTGTAAKFHTGTSEIIATIYLLEGNVAAGGQECLVQIQLNEPVAAGPNDHFIVRTLSPVHTVGGGTIIEAIPKKLRRNQPGLLEDICIRAKAVLIEKEFVEYCVKTAADFAVTQAELSFRTKIINGQIKKILDELVDESKVLYLDSKKYIHKDTLASAKQLLLSVVEKFHNTNPQSPGISFEQLLEASHLQKDVFDGIVGCLIADGKLAERSHLLALPDHHEIFSDDEQKMLDKVESLFIKRLFNPPQWQEIIESISAGQDEIRKVLKILIEHGRLIRIENDLFFHCQAVEQARSILRDYLVKEGRLESVKVKYLLNTTRKFAIPLLDYFDRMGVTRRIGNTRYLKTSP